MKTTNNKEVYQQTGVAYMVNSKGHKIRPYLSSATPKQTTLLQRFINLFRG